MSSAQSPPPLTFVSVPVTSAGIPVGQLAKRLGVPVEHIWLPIRPSSRAVDLPEDSGVALVLKGAYTSALMRVNAATDGGGGAYATFRVSGYVVASPPLASSSSGNNADATAAVTDAMISNRVRMIRAMRGIGDGRRMQLNYKFIPPQYVCFVQTASNSRVVVSKAGAGGAGSEDVCYAAVLLRTDVGRDDLLKEGSIVAPLVAAADEAKKAADNKGFPAPALLNHKAYDNDNPNMSLGGKRPREEGEPKGDRRKVAAAPSALSKLMQTAEGAFLSDVQGTATHSKLWLSVRAGVAANGLHKPPLHKSKLFYPMGAATAPTTGGGNNANSSSAAPRRVVIQGVSWFMIEPHCVSTSYNFNSPSDLLGLSTSKLCGIVVDGAMLGAHRYFRATATAAGDILTKAVAGAVAAALPCPEGEEATIGGSAPVTTTMSLAVGFESAVRQCHSLHKNVALVATNTTAADASLTSSSAAFGATIAAFQQRCKEVALQGYRIVLFATAPELHHMEQQGIEDKLASLGQCVGDLVSGQGMPPITLLVSCASVMTSSAAWSGSVIDHRSAAPSSAASAAGANNNNGGNLQSAINAKMLWRAFVRHTNQNKFPSQTDSFIVVGRKVSGAGSSAIFGSAGADLNDGIGDDTASAIFSDTASTVAINPSAANAHSTTNGTNGISQKAVATTSFLSAYDDVLVARQCVGEDGAPCRIVSSKAFLEGRAAKV